ncbi:Hypothetical predicted protein [Olea europaea subsp. europaea]|uniref:Uncharacterized protein n=1 Tax=Olea europaea subsp. europaea TaxID=158383 RepID=A0A8S0UIU0_OLEEU|nr:Hypothetical predicted protein [Olea europaea subsp. europaea]
MKDQCQSDVALSHYDTTRCRQRPSCYGATPISTDAALPFVVESNLPPPLPLSSFSPLSLIQHSMTMPAALSHLKKMKRKIKGVAISERDEEEIGGLNGRKKWIEGIGLEIPIRTPNPSLPPDLKGVAWDYFFMGDNMPGQSLEEVEEEDDESIIWKDKRALKMGISSR